MCVCVYIIHIENLYDTVTRDSKLLNQLSLSTNKRRRCTGRW